MPNETGKTPETDALAHRGYTETHYIAAMTEKARDLEIERDAADARREKAEQELIERTKILHGTENQLKDVQAYIQAMDKMLRDCKKQAGVNYLIPFETVWKDIYGKAQDCDLFESTITQLRKNNEECRKQLAYADETQRKLTLEQLRNTELEMAIEEWRNLTASIVRVLEAISVQNTLLVIHRQAADDVALAYYRKIHNIPNNPNETN